MSVWTPEWQISVNGGGDYTNLTLSTVSITSGRTDIYSQPRAGYCYVEILNLDESPIEIDVNDNVLIKIKDSTGTFVNLFGGDVTDIQVQVLNSSYTETNQVIRVTALGALSKLPVSLTEGVLAKDFDGDQIYTILEDLLLNNWNEVAPAVTWADYDPTQTWATAENVGLGEIDRPGDYELTARSAETTDIYSLVSALATSGLGYIYEDASGRIGYADSTHRAQYLAANGYTEISAETAFAAGISTIKRIADVRNRVTIQYKNNQEESALDTGSIGIYGQQAHVISTTLENAVDAEFQADFYLGLRAYPQAQFQAITFTLGNGNIDDSDRDALLNVFMGLPLDITDLPPNILLGRFQGFVEGWTFTAGYKRLDITLNLSPTAFSLQSMKWENVSVAESWNTLSSTLDWNSATVVA
jgi:hypothetical protein